MLDGFTLHIQPTVRGVKNPLDRIPGAFLMLHVTSGKVLTGSSRNLAIVLGYVDSRYRRLDPSIQRVVYELLCEDPRYELYFRSADTVGQAQVYEIRAALQLKDRLLNGRLTYERALELDALLETGELTEDDLVDIKKVTPISCEGVVYPTTKQAAAALNLTQGALQKRLISPNFPTYFKV